MRALAGFGAGLLVGLALGWMVRWSDVEDD